MPFDAGLAIGVQPSDPAADARRLLALADTVYGRARPMPGGPGARDCSMDELVPLLGAFLNSAGVPEPGGSCGVGEPYGRAVLEYFTAATGAAAADTDGYVTSSSGEAVLQALYTARRALPKACVYASDQAHPRIERACDLLRMELVTVKSLPEGTMDAEDLRIQVLVRRRTRFGSGREPGVIVAATCGTALRGAVDDIVALRAAAAGPVYLHVDAASAGLVAAHGEPAPRWSFAHGADSLTIGGHQVLGLPVPAGIVLARRALPPGMPGAGGPAATGRALACPRSSLAALLLWVRLRSLGWSGVTALIRRCQDTAAYAVDRLEQAGADPGRFPGSLTVTFNRPPDHVVAKWRLACAGSVARLVTAGPVTRQVVDELVDDVAAARQPAAA